MSGGTKVGRNDTTKREACVIGSESDGSHEPILAATRTRLSVSEMSSEETVPVIVGVGQVLNRDDTTFPSPVDLAIRASQQAATDCGNESVLGLVDTIAAVPIVSWRYQDAGRLITQALGALPRYTMYPHVGGNTPQMLVNMMCQRIMSGETTLGLVVGAESYRSRMRARRNDVTLTWAKQPPEIVPDWTDATEFELAHPCELAQGVMMPTQIYPLFENALCHQAGRSSQQHRRFLGELWHGFSEVASRNPFAWDQQVHSADDIADITHDNRLVGFPYTKRMVSNPDVDMASALIVCSAAQARRLGIDPDRWVYVHSGADANDPYVSTRPSFTESAAIRFAGGAAVELAGTSIDEIAHLDVYSCFPSAVQIACQELHIDVTRQLTVSGGLCFAGGPWNNPVGHAIASMVQVCRTHPNDLGLVTANGGNIQKHSFGVYGSAPPPHGFRYSHPQFSVDTEQAVEVLDHYVGPATLETWTVMHERDGSTGRAHGVVRTADRHRVWWTSSDPAIAEALESEDLIGTPVAITEDAQLRLA